MVASVSACTGPDYYFEIDHALYYLTGDVGVGVWHGEGAKFLGFTGAVFKEQLIAAFNGLGWDGYSRHVQLPKGRNRQPAWDITFSAPKSVSALWSVLGADDRHKIEKLVMQAAKRAIDYLDARALLTRRGKGGKTVEHAKGVYVLCPHGTSRSQDPQLHIHALAINMCVREDGSTGTIRSKDLYQHKMAAGALFRLELASLLSKELGLKIEADRWSVKIAGVPQSLCDEQSKRRQVIEQIAKRLGWTSPELLAELAIQTREAKGVVSMAECTKEWLATGERHSFGRDEATALLMTAEGSIGTNIASRLEDEARNKQLREALQKSVDSLSNQQSYFAERDLVQHVAVNLQASGLDTDDILDAVDDAAEDFQSSISLPGQHYRYYATEETVAAERELLAIAEKNRTKNSHLVRDEILFKAKKVVEKRLSTAIGSPAELTFDQHTALIHVTQEQGTTKLIQGYAGTGKTQMLEAAYLAWKESGYQVFGTALSGKAAAGLEAATGVRSFTISKLMLSLFPELTKAELHKSFPDNAGSRQGAYFEGYRTKAWMKNPLGEALKEMEREFAQDKPNADIKLTDKSILVVDEAGMVPTKVMLRLLHECDRVGAKVVLIGDSLQLPPIEAGGPFVSLCNRLGCHYLTTVIRQRQDWMREATYALIQNEPRLALDLYAENDSLRIANSQKAAITQLVADYGKLSAADFRTSLALTSTRAEASQINAGVQQRRLAASQLQGESALLKNGERVYEHDRIMLTRNDYELGARNGMLGTVVSIQQPKWRDDAPKLQVQLDSPTLQKGSSQRVSTILIDLGKYTHVQIGYAVTTHKAQGATVKSSYVLLGESMLNKQMAFTQLTRASHSTVIYSAQAQLGNTLENLAGRLSQSVTKDLAHDYKIDIHSKRGVQQRQELLRDTLARLAPQTTRGLLAPTAYLSDARFGATQTAAMWLLIGQYTKLTDRDYGKTIAVVTDTFESGRINQTVQSHRRAAQQLDGESVEIRKGQRVYEGDRIVVTINNEQGTPMHRLGTAVGFATPFNAVQLPNGEVVKTGVMPWVKVEPDVKLYAGQPKQWVPFDQNSEYRGGEYKPVINLEDVTKLEAGQYKPWLLVELDPKHEAGQSLTAKEGVAISARDFDKLELGYATTAEKLKDITVESSLVLLPEAGHSRSDIAIQLTRATNDVSLFGEHAHYGQALDAGRKQGDFAKSLEGTKQDEPKQQSQSLFDRYKLLLDEQGIQNERIEQAELSRERSRQL